MRKKDKKVIRHIFDFRGIPVLAAAVMEKVL